QGGCARKLRRNRAVVASLSGGERPPARRESHRALAGIRGLGKPGARGAAHHRRRRSTGPRQAGNGRHLERGSRCPLPARLGELEARWSIRGTRRDPYAFEVSRRTKASRPWMSTGGTVGNLSRRKTRSRYCCRSAALESVLRRDGPYTTNGSITLKPTKPRI